MQHGDADDDDLTAGPVVAPPRRRGHLVDLSPLRASPSFARMWAGTAVSTVGTQLTVVAVGLQVYELTGSTLAVSGVGLAALVPTVLAGLYGGVLADALDRRRLLLVAAVVAWCATATIAGLAWAGHEGVGALYALTALTATAGTVLGATRMAVVPRLLPPHLLPAAAALGGITGGLAVTAGPALAGVLVATAGFPLTYTVDVVLFLGAFLGIVQLPPVRPEGERVRAGMGSVVQGLRFLATAPTVRASFVADIAAMALAQPRVLFPAAGAAVLGGGAVTVGVLTAAGAVGAVLSGLLSGRLTGTRRQGVAIARAIQVYGAAVAAFGVVLAVAAATDPAAGTGSVLRAEGLRPVPVAAAALLLAVAGAADNVSSIFRQAVLQQAVPDHLRGRLQGIFIVVVTGGPRVGDLWTGVLATLLAVWLPPLLGGALVVVALAVLLARQPGFRAYDARHPTP
ncbi:MFS transporter [Cellulomonas marina]|uniref:Transmembrane secretion effector n=1 Tax=Cellulomonas marina TaxID=988821 RepID=A0A1I0VG34_9CELL|nr:MFS transporter [Cellulomonas marina]GIG28020.1 MFS transporter [Cellulomonas marina]SFA74556.1 Transmembrane secretion effector [Cellulomonas marina]